MSADFEEATNPCPNKEYSDPLKNKNKINSDYHFLLNFLRSWDRHDRNRLTRTPWRRKASCIRMRRFLTASLGLCKRLQGDVPSFHYGNTIAFHITPHGTFRTAGDLALSASRTD